MSKQCVKVFFLQCFVLSWEYFNSVICLEKCDVQSYFNQVSNSIIYFKKYLSYFRLSSVVHLGFLQLQRAGASLQLWCAGLLIVAASLVEHRCEAYGLQQLQHLGSSCDAQAQMLHSMWNLPGSGLEHIPCIGKWILCHCITKEVPIALFQLFLYLSNFHCKKKEIPLKLELGGFLKD